MIRHLNIGTTALALLMATPALAQYGFPSCDGPPVLTGEQSGTVAVEKRNL